VDGLDCKCRTKRGQLRIHSKNSGAQSLLALAYIASHKEDAALELLAQLEESGDLFSTGLVYAALGENEKALASFEQIKRWNTWSPLAMRYFFPDVLGPLAESPDYMAVFESVKGNWR